MNKRTLKQLGALHEIIRTLHNEWVSSNYSDELLFKLNLVKKITKNLEEQKRGFSKSKLPYQQFADFIIADSLSASYEELMKLAKQILLAKPPK